MTTEHPPDGEPQRAARGARIGYLNLRQPDVHSPQVTFFQGDGPAIAVVHLGADGTHPTMHVESAAGARALAAAFTEAAELLDAAPAKDQP